MIESTSVSLTLIPGASLGISLGEMCPNSAPITPAAATTLGLNSALLTSYPFLSRNLMTNACCDSPNTPSDFSRIVSTSCSKPSMFLSRRSSVLLSFELR